MTVNTRDLFELRIFFGVNPLEGWAKARPVLEILQRDGGSLAPTTFRPRYDKILPLTLEAVERHFSRRKAPDVLVLTGEQGVGIEWTGYPTGHVPASKLIMRVPFSLLAAPEGTERLLALTKALCRACPPVFGWGHSEEDVRLANEPLATDASAPLELTRVYWLTILGARMVDTLTRARVSSTPAHRIEALENGAVLIVTTALPAEALSPAGREAQVRALAHLRPDLRPDGAMDDLLDRSAKLQPVEARWDPNDDLLFRMIVEAVPLAERRAKALELNAYRPPGTDEWRPAPRALPADVENLADAVDDYHRQGQTFVARFHDELEGLMDGEPDVLPRIDGYFYLRDGLHNDSATLQRLMVPTLGAYLGTMMERHLDGRWTPRQNLDEAQIVVGNRAWLPFLRVKHFTQSKQAALDYSLTRYYREAERHAAETVR